MEEQRRSLSLINFKRNITTKNLFITTASCALISQFTNFLASYNKIDTKVFKSTITTTKLSDSPNGCGPLFGQDI